MTVARHVVVHGRVQGVFYRGWSVEAAQDLGLAGWVRNRRDGTVEMLVAGPEAAVAAMIERCREGPPAARVDRIDVTDSVEEVPVGFEGRATT
ncbi:MAG TPA: acylphosphatase [Allosphingosinicella sp.]|jgi:acylphosphatase